MSDSNIDLPNNSRMTDHKSSEDLHDVRVRKTVKGQAKKKSLGRKFAELLTPKDQVDIKGYLVNDVLLPTVKSAVLTSLDMLLPGGANLARGYTNYSSPIKQRKRSNVDRYSYDREYDRRPRYRDDSPDWQEDITFDTYAEAKDALNELLYIYDKYKHIRITDLYDVADVSIGRYGVTLKHYGWIDIRGVEPVRIGNRWGLSFPKAVELE